MSIWVTILLFVVGLVLIVKGGDWFLDGAVWIAEATGVPHFIIGATVVSLATTLPELTVSIIGVMEGEVDLAVGNAGGGMAFRPEYRLHLAMDRKSNGYAACRAA